MANAKAYRLYSAPFMNEVKVARFTYRFGDDGGAVGTIPLGIFKQKVMILTSRVRVITACTSGGSATVKIGTTADDDQFMDVTSGAVASLTADAVITETAGQNAVVAADQVVNAIIGTAALTAGEIEVIVEYIALQ